MRHTYRAWLDSTGEPIGVQQKLMRHAVLAFEDLAVFLEK
jgi:integrase